MEEAGDNPLLVETCSPRKIQEIDPVELVILALFDQKLDRIGDRRVGSLLQHRKLGLGITHDASLEQITRASKRCILTGA